MPHAHCAANGAQSQSQSQSQLGLALPCLARLPCPPALLGSCVHRYFNVHPPARILDRLRDVETSKQKNTFHHRSVLCLGQPRIRPCALLLPAVTSLPTCARWLLW